MGLSAVLATQHPSGLDQRVLSQVETFIAHQLVTEGDIRAVRDNLKPRRRRVFSLGRSNLTSEAFCASFHRAYAPSPQPI